MKIKILHYLAISFNIIALILVGRDFELGAYKDAAAYGVLNILLYFFNLENHKDL